MTEWVIISGKGGTGKTTITSSFAALAGSCAIADTDVDAANLHLILNPQEKTSNSFSSGFEAEINPDRCTGCGKCQEICRFHAIDRLPAADGKNATFKIDPIGCEGCGICYHVCTDKAVELSPAITGEVISGETKYGPIVYAQLGIAAENSGKLVTEVRTRARNLAESKNLDLLIIDGSPGLGCPVIASITGTDRVLVVTEPTLSGMHDLKRVLDLTAHFGIKTCVCVNKWDLNQEITEEIERLAGEKNIPVAGRVRYDQSAVDAQVAGIPVVENSNNGAAEDIRLLWKGLSEI